jgi:hypothetical protein
MRRPFCFRKKPGSIPSDGGGISRNSIFPLSPLDLPMLMFKVLQLFGKFFAVFGILLIVLSVVVQLIRRQTKK